MPTPFQQLGTIDSRSADIVLTYVEGKPTPIDVPARDLHGGDLRRIAWVRANAAAIQERDTFVPHGEELKEPEPPAEPDARTLRSLAADLVENGAFRVTHPVKGKPNAAPPEPPGPGIEVGAGDVGTIEGDDVGELLPPIDAPAPPAEPEG